MARLQNRPNKTSVTTYFPILLLVIILGLFVAFSDSFAASNLKHEKEILETAINRSITLCYALEGSYPYNLSYLEENYGLTYNKEHFFIDFRYIGSNLRPDIIIIERN